MAETVIEVLKNLTTIIQQTESIESKQKASKTTIYPSLFCELIH